MSNREITDSTCIRPDVDEASIRTLREDAYGNDHLVALAAYMSATGNETRLRILFVLWQAGELCVCELADVFGITQPAVSRHLKILREKALVETRRDAQTIYYKLFTGNPFARMLARFFEEQEVEHVTLKLPDEMSRATDNVGYPSSPKEGKP